MSDFDDEDFADTDVDSDAGSDMRLDCNTGKSGNPQSEPDTDMCTQAGEKINVIQAGDTNNPDEDVCCADIPTIHWASGYIYWARYVVPQWLLEWLCRRDGDVHVMNNVNNGNVEHGITAAWCMNAEAVCCDCLWLIYHL